MHSVFMSHIVNNKKMTETDNLYTLNQIKLTRKYLKLKILEDNVTFRGHEQERNHVHDLMRRTVSCGESHSALMIGPRGSGKTTLINSVLEQLNTELDLQSDAIVVRLNGLLHHEEKVALKSITAQMQLENAIGDRVFGTFAENLSFLVSCLQSGADRACKSMIFILQQFDMFCHSGKTQTLLYNLFDITHAGNAPMCVIGITNRIDVMELLEKRVKSRFSHRHLFLFPNEADAQRSPVDRYRSLFVELLTLPVMRTVKDTPKRKKISRKKSVVPMEDGTEVKPILPSSVLSRCQVSPLPIDPSWAEDWNSHVNSLASQDPLLDYLEKMCYYTVNEQIFRNVLFQIVCKLSPRKPYIDLHSVTTAVDKTVCPEHRVEMLLSLSILQLSLVIATMHAIDVLDEQPINFEMVLHRNYGVSPLHQLLLTLRFYALGTMLLSVADFIGVSKATASRIVSDVSRAIAGLYPDYVKILENTQQSFHSIAGFPKVLGAIDCTHIPIQSPVQCENNLIGNRWLIGDSAYPCTAYLLTPLLNPVSVSDNHYNEAHIRTRNTIERYTKFANTNSSTQTVPRPVILKAFEHLQALEILMPIRPSDSIYSSSETTASRVQKEYKLFTLAVPKEDIKEAVKNFKALPTEISHWLHNAIE